ncbi:HDOD domain-containing protein [Melioribacter sp. OK-6-Me]|uniref:HDOD domain-containing protein n=1 Tax=unclassified Melioribacter TaxID=2627329 RepID=UPI003ED9F52A
MVEQGTTDIKEKIRKQLSGIGNIPAVPQVIAEVSQMLDNEMTSASDLCKVISRDQALAAKILAVANSPLYGLPRRVSTIEFAVVIIGFDHIKNILLALSLLDTFKVRNAKDWNHQDYWRHSILTATGAKRIADDLRYPRSGEVFTAGLLHDLGLVILYKYMNYDYKQIIELVENQGLSFLEAENKILGYTHSHIAEFLLDKWNFPRNIVDAVVNHHTPSESEYNPVLTSLVHLTDYMTQKFNIGAFMCDNNMPLDDNILDILQFGNMEYLEQFIESYKPLFNQHFESLNR